MAQPVGARCTRLLWHQHAALTLLISNLCTAEATSSFICSREAIAAVVFSGHDSQTQGRSCTSARHRRAPSKNQDNQWWRRCHALLQVEELVSGSSGRVSSDAGGAGGPESGEDVEQLRNSLATGSGARRLGLVGFCWRPFRLPSLPVRLHACLSSRAPSHRPFADQRAAIRMAMVGHSSCVPRWLAVVACTRATQQARQTRPFQQPVEKSVAAWRTGAGAGGGAAAAGAGVRGGAHGARGPHAGPSSRCHAGHAGGAVGARSPHRR